MAQLGRPRLDNPRRHVERVRVTDDEHAALTAAADRAGMNLANWMRTKLLAAAKRQR